MRGEGRKGCSLFLKLFLLLKGSLEGLQEVIVLLERARRAELHLVVFLVVVPLPPRVRGWFSGHLATRTYVKPVWKPALRQGLAKAPELVSLPIISLRQEIRIA